MSFEVIATEPFERKLKKLFKKYPSIRKDILQVVLELEKNPTMGTPLGHNCFKIRIGITSKGKGKSGGARIISLVRFLNNQVFLLDLYDKSDLESISESDLQKLISKIRG